MTKARRKATNKATHTLVFEDHGQDFLEWDVAGDGQIVAVRPFQGRVWRKWLVVNELRSLQPGDLVRVRKAEGDKAASIKYPLTEIRKAGEGKQ